MVMILIKMINLVVEVIVLSKWLNMPKPFYHQPKKPKNVKKNRKMA